MPNKMLIDASHREETRVVVVRGNRIEEFDFESQSKKQLKGNIYLARVTRVEPSLQAAFVEYGGNRHGFLAFSEIHPDYYQIPVADRQALLAADAADAKAEEELDDEKSDPGKRRRKGGGKSRGRATTQTNADDDQNGEEKPAADEDIERQGPAIASAVHADVVSELPESDLENLNDGELADTITEDDQSPKARKTGRSRRGRRGGGNDAEEREDVAESPESDSVEMVGAEDALDELPSRRMPSRRSYKIQEVIKRRQILLVQVVKEERGNKGAALTTYLSLAGRYSVLMPNTARGGGISRKITSIQDRKRLKDVVTELDVPQGMGVILRTAGANRTKAEIKRDYDYLMRLWMQVRNLTLESTAPALVHEEGSLIKRSVRDLYNKDIDEILVAGDEGYREAKDFMRMLMPSHAKVVQPYRDRMPIFARSGIEAQLDRMLQPQVTLKSGGYIIINQTEALVAIDVNSGRSTREHSIENTALQTNLEAAEEVARQLRLRDLAGLVVIDFIDMEENRNNRAVEKRLKDCLKKDRARIQVGRISHFGLLEMSRQRIRASVLESTMRICEHCNGTGNVRSDSSVALHVIRGIEEYLLKESGYDIIVRTAASTALYVLNNKRENLTDLEERFGLSIKIEADESLGGQHFSVIKGEISQRAPTALPLPLPVDETEDEEDAALQPETDEDAPSTDERSEEGGGRKRRRRRRRRGGQNRENEPVSDRAASEPAPGAEAESEGDERTETAAGENETRKRRRGRRGGKRSKQENAAPVTEAVSDFGVAGFEENTKRAAEVEPESEKYDAGESGSETGAIPDPLKPAAKETEKDESSEKSAKPKRPKRPARKPQQVLQPTVDAEVSKPRVEPVVISTPSNDSAEEAQIPQKQGWWRRKGFL